MLLLCDVSKREVSTQPLELTVLPELAPRLPAVGMLLLLCDVSKREVSTQPKLTVLPHAYLMLVWIKLAKSTRLPGSLPVFYHFYPSTRFFKFLPVLGIPISKKKSFFFFLPVNIGKIRELINHFRSYRP